MRDAMRGQLQAGLIGALAVALMLFASAAQAQTTTTTFNVPCTSSGELCSPPFTMPITTSGVLQVQYTASPGHCSNVRVHVLLDGTEVALSAFLAPGASSSVFNLGPVSPGTHTLGLQGEGTIGGCNTGNLANWGGTAAVTVSAASIATTPVPAPGIVATALVFLLGAFLYLYRAKR